MNATIQRTRRAMCALLASALIALPAVALAQPNVEPSQGDVSRVTTELSDEIFSPFCPGKTLSMCPSPNAAKVRREIQEMAREGKNKEQIKQEILSTYGEEFRIVEPPTEDNMMLLVVLGIALLAAMALVVLLTRGRKSASEQGAENNSTSSEEDEVDESLSDEERSYLDDLHEEL